LPALARDCYHPGALSGQAGAYFALFSEIGILLLVTTLVGALAGHWVDEQLGTVFVFVVVGFLGGAAIGTVGIYRLITGFLARFED
jgi:putative F0F1-ATPase subunit (Ca2+/Mg2+ transporter)